MTNQTENKIKVTLVGEINYDERKGHSATVLIVGKQYNAKVFSDGSIRVPELDLRNLNALGIELDYSEVSEAFHKVHTAKQREIKEKETIKRAAEWEARNEFAKSLGMSVYGTKESYITNGSSYSLDLRYEETHMGKEIYLSVSKSGNFFELTNAIYDWDSSNRKKRFKRLEKLVTAKAEMLANCKELIAIQIKGVEKQNKVLENAKELFGADVTITEEWHSSGNRGRGYTTKLLTIGSAITKRTIKFSQYYNEQNSWSIRGLAGQFTTEELQGIIKIVRG